MRKLVLQRFMQMIPQIEVIRINISLHKGELTKVSLFEEENTISLDDQDIQEFCLWVAKQKVGRHFTGKISARFKWDSTNMDWKNYMKMDIQESIEVKL